MVKCTYCVYVKMVFNLNRKRFWIKFKILEFEFNFKWQIVKNTQHWVLYKTYLSGIFTVLLINSWGENFIICAYFKFHLCKRFFYFLFSSSIRSNAIPLEPFIKRVAFLILDKLKWSLKSLKVLNCFDFFEFTLVL